MSLLDDVSAEEAIQYVPQRAEIVPGLWLGALPDYSPPDVKYVLSLVGSSAEPRSGQRLIVTGFADSLALPEEQYLYGLADLGITLWKDGPILVHCLAGLNRSGLIVGLMLVRSGTCTAQEAVDLMRAKRSSAVLHNPTFRNWLLTQATK